MKVVIAGGGTAGHVNPALALARALEPSEITMLGTEAGAEARLVPAAGFALETISVSGFDRGRPWLLPVVGGRALKAVAQARSILKRIDPDVVVGMGGYVSLPACSAARLRGIPAVTHEQNIVLGLANRVCKPLVQKICVSFDETLAQTGGKGVLTGNPVLPHLLEVDIETTRHEGMSAFGLDPARKTLLVFGGSLGARRLNEAASGLAHLWSHRSDVQIVHISGRAEAARFLGEAERLEGDLIYRPVGYVDEMAQAYAVADLALCRGGATTVAELGIFGLPAVIVPYPYHRDRQQELHGRALERRGAARVVPDADADASTVAEVTGDLLGDDAALVRMREAMRAQGRPDAARAVADVVRGAAG